MEQEFNLFDYYTLTNQKNILTSYKGPMTDVMLAEISRDIRDKFAENPKASKKIFSIFMELAQNILYYSAEKVRFGERQDSVGTILITEGGEHYTFSCGNLVESSYIEELVDHCKTINAMDRDALRDYKREVRSAPKRERSKGAGIGLIQVAITADTPLSVEYAEVDEDFSFFSLSVRIHK